MSKDHILGINWEQNASVSLFRNGKCLGALSNERLTRRKNDEAYPREAIDALLSQHSITKADIKAVVFVSKQWSPAWILLRHYTSFNADDYLREQNEFWKPKIYDGETISVFDVFDDKLDLQQFPGEEFWKSKVNEYAGSDGHVSDTSLIELGQSIRTEVVQYHLGDVPVHFMDHSSCHNSYAYFSQGDRYSDFLSVSLDAFGDGINYSAKIFSRVNDTVVVNDVVNGGDFIIGRLYRYVTLMLGLKPNEHEYKVMGLAPYCKEKYFGDILSYFKSLQNVEGLHFKYNHRPKDHFFEIRDALFSKRFDSIAGGLQAYTEELVTAWINNLVSETGIHKICYAGGIAMNVKANMLISKLPCVHDLHVPQAPDDTSQAIGAVYQYLFESGVPADEILPIVDPYLGLNCASNSNAHTSVLDLLSEKMNLKDYTLVYRDHIKKAAQMLSDGLVLGVAWNKEEFGARALGNRSVIADPRTTEIKKKINENIKDRDFWMPFAASVLEEYAEEYFKLDLEPIRYRFMTNTVETTSVGRKKLSAAIHPYDETCRPNIVMKGSNHNYEELITEFGKITDTYAVLNTSLNLHGLPICSSYTDVIHVFVNGDLDGLLLDDLLLVKK